MFRRASILTCLSALVLLATPAGAQTKLLRFPDLHGDQLVFTFAGDLWLAHVSGGSARRLTSHPGLEVFAKFSPDGQHIAFTGQYDGDEQVYVIPTAGGAPRQLTFYPAPGPLPPRWGYDNQVYGWTPDGEGVLFRSMRDGWDLSDTRLYTVGLEGALPVALPMPYSGGGDLSPDATRSVYSPLTRDFRHWKRYQGGWAQDLYIFDLESHAAELIASSPRSERDPMWIGERIYFSSDRDGTLNLYAYDPTAKSTEQLTDSDLWDVRWPSADHAGGRIVYEQNGELVVYDIAAGTSRGVEIFVPDDGVASRAARISVADRIEDIGLSPKGERALFAARGDIFTAPIEHGPTRNLTRSSGVRDREPAWSPDGKHIAFVSDRDGEQQIYLIDQAGREAPRQLTDGPGGQLSNLLWSPDSQHIAYRDQSSRLLVVDVESQEVVEVADDDAKFGLAYEWSPHGGYLAFDLTDPNGFRSIHIWSAAQGETHRVTDELWNEYSPTWDPEGKYLFYLSDRQFQPQIGSFEFNYLVDRETYIYALALREDVEHPFPPRSDEVTLEEEDDADDEEAEDSAAKKKKKGKKDADEDEADEDEDDEDEADEEPIQIDFDGLAGRVARVPVDADNYFALSALEGHLLYVRGGAGYYGRQSDVQPEIKLFSFEDREATTLVEGIRNGALSADGKKLLVQTAAGYQLLDAAPGGADSAKTVSTDGLVADRIPVEEWAQIFDETWRFFRDFFYVDNMHGYDWPALRDQYRPLLEHVAHRSDLNYVLSEMISELNVSHSYVTGGDYEVPERPQVALLGARFELDAAAGRYRISDIFPGQNEEGTYRSPLTEVGVGAAVGDYVLAINGENLAGGDNPFRLLRHAGGGAVELTLSSDPEGEQARQALVAPIRNEDSLLYLRWVEGNRSYVAEQTGGRVGYLHLPDMGGSGIREWIKWFYGQVRKEGLVIDVRSNGGGNVSQMIIERLRRELMMADFERHVDIADTVPNVVFHGHLVCLLDEDTASDGDQFAWLFRRAGLGPLIGKRSWGGVVGIYGSYPLIDGGGVSVPEAGSADPEGRWVIEGYGVDPDIEVDNDPREVLAGRDQQLDKAIEVILGNIESEPRSLPERPAPPVKTP